MAKLGKILATCALGPVNYAGSCIQASRVVEGLKELAPDSLYGGLERGVAQIAGAVGVRPGEILSVLPTHRIKVAMDRLTTSHKLALDAWNLYAGRSGGLLDGVADLTVDGRAPDASLCLERLAKKVSRDKPFSEPLAALANDVAEWQEVIEQCRAVVDDGRAFERAYRRRRMRTYAIATIVGVVVSACAVLFLRWHAARSRVERVLEADDPCAVDALEMADLERASDEQRQRAGAKANACTEARSKADADRRAALEAQAKAAEAEKKKKEREASCARLAADLGKGALDDADVGFAGTSGSLLARAAKGALELGDLGPDDPALPCDGDPSSGGIRDGFAKALASAPWGKVENPSPFVITTLGARAAELPDWPKRLVASRAESIAKKALVVGEPALVDRALRLCKLEDALGKPTAANCRSLAAWAAKK